MTEAGGSTISFDVLLRGETDDLTVAPANLDKLRPAPDAIDTCFRWLTQQGVTCHRTGFGLACEAEVELFESLFGVRVAKRTSSVAGPPIYELRDDPQPPPEIRHLVSQITVAQPPTFFT
jgi:hypothetical protein